MYVSYISVTFLFLSISHFLPLSHSISPSHFYLSMCLPVCLPIIIDISACHVISSTFSICLFSCFLYPMCCLFHLSPPYLSSSSSSTTLSLLTYSLHNKLFILPHHTYFNQSAEESKDNDKANTTQPITTNRYENSVYDTIMIDCIF